MHDIKSVWFTAPFSPFPLVEDDEQRAFAKEELKILMSHLYYLIQNAFWMNPYPSVVRAEKKLLQLLTANKVGLKIPQTCISNSSETIRAFIESQIGDVVYKTLKFRYFLKEYERKSDQKIISTIPTSIIKNEHYEILDSIKYSGGIFQQYLNKAYEIRINVIGNVVLSARIDSQTSINEIGKIDWRHSDLSKKNVHEYALPNEIKEKCLRCLNELGLFWGSIDMIKTVSGEYVFLEVNPVTSFQWLEKITNLPISRTLALALAHPEKNLKLAGDI